MHKSDKFEVWIDSLDENTILHAKSLGILHGVTTNPSILSKNGNFPLKSIGNALELFEGPLAVQVTSLEASQMINQAKSLAAISSRIIVKIPCVQEGYKAMYVLQQENIPVLATTIYTMRQYYLASFYGANYAAPYYSRMLKLYQDLSKSLSLVKQMVNESKQNQTKVMLAALETPEQLDDLLALGANVATLPAEIYAKWLGDFPKASIDLQQFSQDWQKIAPDNWL